MTYGNFREKGKDIYGKLQSQVISEVVKIKTTRVEKHRIKKIHKFFPIIDDLCWKSKNVYNYGNYIVKQEFIKNQEV